MIMRWGIFWLIGDDKDDDEGKSAAVKVEKIIVFCIGFWVDILGIVHYNFGILKEHQ